MAIWYATWPDAARPAVHILDSQRAPPPPGAIRAPAPHIPAYLIGYRDGRRELLDLFAQRGTRADELLAASAGFAHLVGWGHRVVWAQAFRASPALRHLEFLRGYAGCPIPEGLTLAVELTLDAAGGQLSLVALAERVALATGLDQRLCRSAILRLAWECELIVDGLGELIGLHTLISRTPA